MNRPLIAAACLMLLASMPLCAQQDRTLMLQADFDSLLVRETFPEGANGAEKAAITIGRQLLGHNYYNPPNVLFLRQAVREIGPVRGILATSDRLLRASKIGTADYSLPRPPRGIEEGPEAYSGAIKVPTVAAATDSGTAVSCNMLEPPVRKGQGRLQHVPGGCQAEFRSIAADYDFALYLIDNDLKRDALRLVSSPCFTPTAATTRRSSPSAST